ncbi:hypothetical protein ACO2Q7_07585 [Rathayibacter sp. KR2-224]|uniref:hypothetical protein n=1 Tax=Rathayibacter sp. KR2-224 TaxID=3400913 RepID=UPI003BFCA924
MSNETPHGSGADETRKPVEQRPVDEDAPESTDAAGGELDDSAPAETRRIDEVPTDAGEPASGAPLDEESAAEPTGAAQPAYVGDDTAAFDVIRGNDDVPATERSEPTVLPPEPSGGAATTSDDGTGIGSADSAAATAPADSAPADYESSHARYGEPTPADAGTPQYGSTAGETAPTGYGDAEPGYAEQAPAGYAPSEPAPAGYAPAEQTAAGYPPAEQAPVYGAPAQAAPAGAPAAAPVTEEPAAEPAATQTNAEPEPVPYAATAAAATPMYVTAPTPPRRRGNRLVGILIDVIAAVVYAVVFAAVALGIFALRNPHTAVNLWERYLQTAGFWAPVVVFFLVYALVIAIVNRAGWWAHVIGSFVVGVAVYFGYVAGALVTVQAWTLKTSEVNQFLGTLWVSPLTIAAAVVAREVAMWFGAWIAARGRRVRAANLEAQREHERRMAAGPATPAA